MSELTPGEALTQLGEIRKLINEHQEKQNCHRSFGTPAEQIRAILREYEDKTVKAYSGVKHFRDDMLTYFRALSLVLTMTGNAGTHAEKNARLRGAIELLESAVEKLRHAHLEDLFSIYHWPDVFRSDYPTRSLMERIHDLERQLKDAQPKDAETETANREPSW